MTNFWSVYIILLVAINVVACVWLLIATRKKADKRTTKTTGHSFDGIEELDNPLPRWWLWSFWASIIFSVVYLVLFPGLGAFSGTKAWSSEQQWQEEKQLAEKTYGAIYAQYANQDFNALMTQPEALMMGKRLFMNNCSTCHGIDARGGPGFPNLTDNDWLYGGGPEAIKASITNGRQGQMPPLGAGLGKEGVNQVASYILSLNDRPHSSLLAQQGRDKFKTFCSACHGADAKGNPAFGAPNLTNNIWLYGGSLESIKKTIMEGRNGHMPAHKDILGEARIHLVAAYVYSLSHKEETE